MTRHAAVDVLASPRLPAVIAALREHADVVILDAPPREPGASALAAVASAVLLVVRVDAAGAAQLDTAARALAQAPGPPFGVVVNRRAARRPGSRRPPDGAVAQAPPRAVGPAADGATHAAGRS
jgi:Mrp family chromosome partitioning ATPase